MTDSATFIHVVGAAVTGVTVVTAYGVPVAVEVAPH